MGFEEGVGGGICGDVEEGLLVGENDEEGRGNLGGEG